jgi:hypothetical protein
MDFLKYAKDKHEIEQVYILYCDLVDHKQFDGMTGVFTEDAVQDYSTAYGNVVNGVAPLIASMHANLGEGSNCGPTHHNVVNFRVSVEGDTAESRCIIMPFTKASTPMRGKFIRCGENTTISWRARRKAGELPSVSIRSS